jgi:hypothetical protein
MFERTVLNMKKNLTNAPARELNSREVAKIIAGLMGSLVSWNDVDTVMSGIDHIAKHREAYREQFVQIKRIATEATAKGNFDDQD